MKRILVFLLTILLILSLGVLTSCKKDKKDDVEKQEENEEPDTSGTNSVTELLIEVLPGKGDFTEVYTKGDQSISGVSDEVASAYRSSDGYVIVVETEGYSEELCVLCGVDNGGKVVGVKVFSHKEPADYAAKVFPLVEGLEGAYSGYDYMTFTAYTVSGMTLTSGGIAKAVKCAILTYHELSDDKLTSLDILNDDLSEYVEIGEEYYKGYTVTVDPARVSEFDVENELIKILYKYKGKEPVDGDGVISVGDSVDIFYKGYYFKDDGERVYFEGGSNVGGTAYTLGIGSASFIPGFEYNLIGKRPADYTPDNPIVVETFFPENYQSAELAGKTAYFEVEVVKLTEYEVPELNESFITDTLKLSAETLAEFEGATLTEKYRSYIREAYLKSNGLDVDSLKENAFWESVMKGGEVKKYPEVQLKEIFDSFVSELEYYYYNNYYSYYYKYEEFMCLYIGLEVGSDWKGTLMDMAKDQIKQQLIFYRIMDKEELRPDADEYAALFDEYLTEALASEGITADKYNTEEEYFKAKAEYKAKLIEARGEEYFKAMIYYNITMETVLSYANVVEIAE